MSTQAGVMCVLEEILGEEGACFQLEPIKVLRSFKWADAIPKPWSESGFSWATCL